MFRTKLVRSETKVLDAQSGRVSAVLSTEDRDRDGDIIRVEGWKLDSFLSHPVLLSSHNYHTLRSQIGEWEDVKVCGKKLIGTARYYVGDGNEEADWGFKLAQRGRAAYSVGFIPDMEKAVPLDGKDAGAFGSQPMEFRGQELLETSQVTVPSNPHALQRMAQAPDLHPVLREVIEAEIADMDAEPDSDLAALRRTVAEIQAGMAALADAIYCGALPPHTTPKADENAAWDAGAEVRAAEGRAQLRRMHAWVDSDGDPDAKASYKLPHHRASGQVVWRGVAAAMAALQGGRGGVAIPTSDRAGVYRHLARHYAQFDREPPELRSIDYRGLFREAMTEGFTW